MNRGVKSKVRPPDFRGAYRHVRIPPAAVSDPNHHPIHVLSAVRLRRAPTGQKLYDLVNKMDSVARLATGFFLEMRLIDGTIDINDLLPELLKMGNATMADLNAIDGTKITAAMEEISDLPEKLKADVVNDAIEKRFVMLENMRKMSGNIQNLLTLNGQEDYKTLVDSGVSNLDYNMTDIQQFGTNGGVLLDKLTVLNNTLDTDPNFATDVQKKQFMGQLKDAMENFQADQSKVSGVISDIQKIKATNSTFLKPLEEEYAIRANYTPKAAVAADQDEFKTFNTLLSASDVFKPVESYLATIYEIISSFQYSYHWKPDKLPGFPRGHDDLRRYNMKGDYDWIKFFSWPMQESLKALDKVFELMNKLELKIDFMYLTLVRITKEETSTTREVFSKQTNISKITSDDLETVKAFDRCFTNHTLASNDLPNINKMDAVLPHIKAIHKELEEISFFQYDVPNSLTAIMTEVKDIANANSASVLASIGKLKNELKDDVSKVILVLQHLAGEKIKFENFTNTLPSRITSIRNNFHTIGSYQTELNSSELWKLYQCLNEIGEKGKVISVMMEQVVDYRKHSYLPGGITASEIVEKVLEMRSYAPKVLFAAKQLNGTEGVEIDVLKKLMTSAELDSQKLGLAVQGLKKIHFAAEEMSVLKVLYTDDLSYIETAANNHRSSLTTQEFNDLLSIASLGPKVGAMYQQIEALISILDKFSGSKFEDYFSIFKFAAENVKTVSFNGYQLLDAVQKVMKMDREFRLNAIHLDHALYNLARLDLDFDSYKMGEVEESLKRMDQFFLNYASSVRQANWDIELTETSLSPDSGAALEDTTDGSIPRYVWGIAGVIALMAAAALFMWCLSRKETAPVKKPLPSPAPPIDPDDTDINDYVGPVAFTRTGERPKGTNRKRAKVKAVGEPVHIYVIQPELEEKSELDKTQPYNFSSENVIPIIIRYNSIILNGFKGKLRRRNLRHVFFWEHHELNHLYPSHPSDQKYGPANEKRTRNQHCRSDSAVIVEGFSDNFIHANGMYIDGKKWNMCQGPLDGAIEGTVSTLEKHWAMICQYDVAIIMQLCDFVEDNQEKCARYYTDAVGMVLRFGKYSVTTKAIIDVSTEFTYPQHYKCFKLECTNVDTGKVHNVRLLRFVGWPENAAPLEPEHGAEMVNYLDSVKGHKLVHCSDGVGRTGTLVAIKMGLVKVLDGTGKDVLDFMKPVRACRLQAVENGTQAFYILMCVGHELLRQRGMELEEFDKLSHIWYLVCNKLVRGCTEEDADYEYRICPKPHEDEEVEITMDREIRAKDEKLLYEELENIAKKWAVKRKRDAGEVAAIFKEAGVEMPKVVEPTKEQKKTPSKGMVEKEEKAPSKSDKKERKSRSSKKSLRKEQVEQKPEKQKSVEEKPKTEEGKPKVEKEKTVEEKPKTLEKQKTLEEKPKTGEEKPTVEKQKTVEDKPTEKAAAEKPEEQPVELKSKEQDKKASTSKEDEKK